MSNGTITITNMLGKTVQVSGNGIATVQDCLNYFFGGANKVPSNVKVQIGATEATATTAVREGDVVLLREGEFARKRSISGARS